MQIPRFCAVRGCEACLAGDQGARLAPQQPTCWETRVLVPDATIGVAAVGLNKQGRQVLSGIFKASNEFHSCGIFPDARAVRLAGAGCQPDVFLVQLALSDTCGIRFARELLRRTPGPAVILVTALRSAELVQRTVMSGINGLLVEPLGLGTCLATLRFTFWRWVAACPQLAERKAGERPAGRQRMPPASCRTGGSRLA